MAGGECRGSVLKSDYFDTQRGAKRPFWKLSLGKSESTSRTSMQGKGNPMVSFKTLSALAIRRAVWKEQHRDMDLLTKNPLRRVFRGKSL